MTVKRNVSLAEARVAGYHDDRAAFTRLVIESRVNRNALTNAWHEGSSARAAGMKCYCRECRGLS